MGRRVPFLLGLWQKSEFEKCRILGARWCACWSLEMVSVDKFSQVREDLFPAQSLEKKRHLLEHDKHLATALWLMGPKTEVSSVHFQHWLIYPHFNLLYVLGGDKKTPQSPDRRSVLNTVHVGKYRKCDSKVKEIQLTNREKYSWWTRRNTVYKLGEIQLTN